ncbi:hypothetical protein CRG98_042496 [Punica granatum]|uniref:R13L1/DRL21-like LRR repeat region domain-containing protein n=1 Tax=Punica granatum TaxID=22663 RepID=A0A2I0HZM3_PUNGR|nr:hypothetical protein CRG98_042496 [Punica granatum]
MTVSSKSLSTLTYILFSGIEDAEDLPVELFRSLPSLEALVISECRRLKALPVRAILRYLPSLEMLEISECKDLDLSMDEDSHDGVGEGMNNLQLQGMTSQGKLRGYPQLDFSGESGNQRGMPNLQSGEPTKLRELRFYEIDKMKTLPWWMQHLTNLEELSILDCSNLKALPEWFPNLTSLKQLRVIGCGKELPRRCREITGEDWPKISHIQKVDIMLRASSSAFLLSRYLA